MGGGPGDGRCGWGRAVVQRVHVRRAGAVATRAEAAERGAASAHAGRDQPDLRAFAGGRTAAAGGPGAGAGQVPLCGAERPWTRGADRAGRGGGGNGGGGRGG